LRRFTIIAAMAILLSASIGSSQSSAYQRKAKKSSLVNVEPKPTEGAAPETKPKKDGDEKVDISDLQERYWAPRDTEFKVVQNRRYTKDNRFAFTGAYGSLINDPYLSGSQLALTGHYYFTERTGVGLNYSSFNTEGNRIVKDFQSRFGAPPNHTIFNNFYGASFHWIPIYAKLSLLEQKIIYFDFSISPGIGYMQYEGTVDPLKAASGQNFSAPVLTLDIAQHFFLNKNFALMLEMKNRFFQQQIEDAQRPGTIAQTTFTHSISILLGLTFYLDRFGNKEELSESKVAEPGA